MKLRRDLGFYVPAFFMMKVDVDEPIEEIIGSEYERIFSHELVHFIQDVSTTYGLINISKCVDLVKSQNKFLRERSLPISLPLSARDLGDTVMANNDLFSLYVGDNAEKYKEFPDSYSVINVIEDEMNVDFVTHPVKYFNIRYGSEVTSTTEDFHFGAAAIYESMASLIENEIYGDESRKKSFPYDSAMMVAEHLCPRISKNRLAVSELCEASLMYYSPAEVFVDSLRKIHDLGLDFQEPNKYYLYVLNNFSLEGNSAHSEYLNASNLAASQLNDLFTVSPFNEEKWATAIVIKARKIRSSNISISAQLFNKGNLISRSALMSVINIIGMPVVFNRKFDAWVRATEKDLHTPLMYPAVLSFHEILQGIQEGCVLHEHCNNQKSGYTPDLNCHSAPWIRLGQGKSCYFSFIWRMWGLESVRISKN